MGMVEKAGVELTQPTRLRKLGNLEEPGFLGDTVLAAVFEFVPRN